MQRSGEVFVSVASYSMQRYCIVGLYSIRYLLTGTLQALSGWDDDICISLLIAVLFEAHIIKLDCLQAVSKNVLGLF